LEGLRNALEFVWRQLVALSRPFAFEMRLFVSYYVVIYLLQYSGDFNPIHSWQRQREKTKTWPEDRTKSDELKSFMVAVRGV
jgi:hypothetical protein